MWTTDGAKNETVPEEPEPEPEPVEPEPIEPGLVEPETSPSKSRRTSKSAKSVGPENFAARDFGRKNLISKRSGNLW